jgi:hypothetical protein
MQSSLRHPASLVARAAFLGPVLAAGLQDSAAALLSVAALDLLAEQARTAGDPELALKRAMESASLRDVLAGVAGPDAVESCLAALRQRDLDLLAAHLCTPVVETPLPAAVPAA